MDLLKRMLERDADNRVSSKDALNHPAFHAVLSKSPLISKNFFNAESLIQHAKLTEEWEQPSMAAEHGDSLPAITIFNQRVQFILSSTHFVTI